MVWRLEKNAIFAESFNNFKNKYNGKKYESTDEFRRVQEEGNQLTDTQIKEYHKDRYGEKFGDLERRKLGRIYERLLTRNSGTGFNSRADLIGKENTVFHIGEVNPILFHDIFEINRKYLPNGELVDLHDDYSNCKCFISDDGLCGFAIEPDGNLVSVFS